MDCPSGRQGNSLTIILSLEVMHPADGRFKSRRVTAALAARAPLSPEDADC